MRLEIAIFAAAMNECKPNTEGQETTAARANRFRQCERLRLRSMVETLFAEGRTVYEWPLRAVVLPFEAERLDGMFRGHIPEHTGPLQMLVTVPKRKRRHAVDRVVCRRRVREAWRLHRQPLYDVLRGQTQTRTLAVGLVYVADRNVDYARIAKAVSRIIGKISERLEKGEGCEDRS